jgi:hypothetical protein
MPARLVETRVDAAEAARIDAFIRATNGASKRAQSDAIRALLRLGLDAAAQPRLFDERWLDLEERLARIEQLLAALGRCVCANPALTAWLLGQAGRDHSEAAKERVAESIELLIHADWDERCRARGIPRPRHVPKPRKQPVGQPTSGRAPRVYRVMLRLPESYRERVHALALRLDQPPLVALRRLVEIGIHVAEAETWRDDIDRLLDSARRIEIQLDEIGALATGPASVIVHLWRREKDLSEEWEQAVVTEVGEVAEAAWMNLLAGPPMAAPAALVGDEEDDEAAPERG